jgi:hypothetical protein
VDYCLNLAWLKQPDAEARCVQQCCHLTYFSSIAEQEEVEGWYITQVGYSCRALLICRHAGRQAGRRCTKPQAQKAA